MGSAATKEQKCDIAKRILIHEKAVDALYTIHQRTMLHSTDMQTLLHSTVRAGDVEAVQFLVQNGAGNVRDKHGNLPLWYALQHKDADVRGPLEEALSAHAAEILDEVEADVERYLTTGVGTAGVAEGRGDAHPSGSRTTTSTADRVGKDDVDRDTDALQCTEGREGRKVEWLQKEDNSSSSSSSGGGGGEDLLCWLRGLPTVDPPLGYTDEHVRHMEAGFRVVCKRLLEDIGKRREAAVTRGYVEVEDWMAARDPFELLLSGFMFTSDCVEYVMGKNNEVVCDKDGTPTIAKGTDGRQRYIRLTERALLDHHGSAAESQSLALYTTMNTAMRAVGQLPEVKEWKGEAALNVFELSPAPRQLHVIATFAPLIRGLQRLIGSRRKQLRTVFRGIAVNVSAKYTLGTRVVWNCFTSTTLKRDVAKTFMYGNGGTFFVVVSKGGAADVKFSSVYAGEDELLYTANIEFRVQWKLSPTLLRMMGLRFDVIVMQEVCEGVGAGLGVGVEKTSAAEKVGVLQEVMEHTVVFFADYLAQYVEGRVGDATCVEESETRPLMKEVRVWLRTRAGRKRRALRKQMAVAAAEGTAKARTGTVGKCDTWCLVGEGGSGKTSASIAILSGLVQSVTNTDSEWRDTDVDAKPYFPVFVALPTVKKHLLEEGGLDRFVLESFALKEADRAFLADRYEVVLVLDSLDEVGLTQEEVRAVVAEKGLVCRHPWVRAHCSVLLTVRGEYLDSVDVSPSDVCGSGVRAVYMQPFTEKDARVYITRVNEAWEIKLKEQKKEKETKDPTSDNPERTVWVREEDVEGLVRLRDPFVLHIACHAQCSGDASEVMIFEQYLNTWTKEMVSCGRDSCDEDVLAREVEAVLRAGELVACRMLATNEWQGTVSVMSQYLEQQHGVSKEVWDACFRCLPFRIEDFGKERSTFTFRHKSLGEYLAARRLARDPTSTLELLGQCSFSKEYQRVLVFFAALVCADDALYNDAYTELLAAVKRTRGADAGGDVVTVGSNAAALLARARFTVSGEDLSWIRVENCDLRGCQFVETKLTGASLSNAWVEHTEFLACDMNDVEMSGCSLGKPLHALLPAAGAGCHSAPVSGLAVARDGSILSAGGNTICKWDAANGKQAHAFEGHTARVVRLAVHKSLLVSSSDDGTVRVWNLATGQESCCFEDSESRAELRGVAVTPDASHVVVGAVDHTVRVWDVASGRRVAILRGHTAPVGHVAVTPDGLHVVSCSEDETVRMWELRTGKETRVFEGHGSRVLCVAVTTDGSSVATSSSDGSVRVMDVGSGKQVRDLMGNSAPVCGVSLTPDGAHVVSCSVDGTVRVWSVITGEEVAVVRARTTLHCVSVSPDGRDVICGCEDKTVRVWSICTEGGGRIKGLRLKRVIGAPVTDPLAVRRDPLESHDKIAETKLSELKRYMDAHATHTMNTSEVMSLDAFLKKWVEKQMVTCGVKELVSTSVLAEKAETVLRAGELVACRMLATNEWQGTVSVMSQYLEQQHGMTRKETESGFRCLPFRIEDYVEERSMFTFCHKSLGEYLAARRLARDPTSTLELLGQCSFSKEYQRVLVFFAALVCADDALYNDAYTELLAAVKRTRGADAGGDVVTVGSNAAALLARARFTVSGEDLSGIRVENCDLRGCQFVETKLTGASLSNAWVEHTEFLACDMNDVEMRGCSLGKPLRALLPAAGAGCHSAPVSGLAVAPDGSILSAGGNTICKWDAANGKQTRAFKGHTARVVRLAVHKSLLVSSSDDGTVRVWNLATGQESCCFEDSESRAELRGVAVTPDASHVVVGAVDHTVRVWDVASGRRVAILRGHTAPVGHVAVTPDGLHVVSCSEDETVRMWELRTGKETRVFEGHGSRVLCVAVTPESSVLTGSSDGSVRVMDVGSGKQVRDLMGNSAPVCGVSLTPDGAHVVSCSVDGTVRVWSVITGEEVAVVRARTTLHCVSVSPDGRDVICGCEDKTVRVWSICTEGGGRIKGLRLKRVIGAPVTDPLAVRRDTDEKDVDRVNAACKDNKAYRSMLSQVERQMQLTWLQTHTVQTLRVMSLDAFLKKWVETLMVTCGFAELVSTSVLAEQVEAVLRAGELVACRMLATNEWQGTVSVMSQYLEQQHGMTRKETESGFRWLPFRIEYFVEEGSAFTFCHKSLGEYLAARRLARDPTSTLELLGQCSFSKEYQRVLVFFAALVCADDALYNDAYTELLAAVKRTRGADAGGDVVTVGSNAAALLARARFTVSGEDLSGIRVENCDLRGCQFVETKLTGASLSNAWVEHTEFYCCAMKDVDMSGCSLGTALPPLFFHPGEQCPNVHAVTVTPDGCHIVAGGGDGTIRLFDTTTGERGFSFKAHSAACGAVVVTPDASRIVTCSADKTVRVWDVQTGQQLCVLGEDIPNTRALAVTPDGSRVVCCSGKSVHVWALWTGKEVLVHDNEAFGSAAVVCLTPNGSRILSCSGRVLQVWDLEKVEVMRRFEGHAMDVLSLAVTPDGKAVSGSQDETARLWNVSTGEVVRVFRSCFPINAVAVTPDGCHLVAGCGARLYVWEVSTGEEVRVLNADGDAICAVAVSPDGRRVVSASSLESFISVWDVQPEKPDLRAETHTGTVHAVVVTPKGHIISCAADLMMRVWDTSTGQQVQTLALKRQTVGQIPAVSPDGHTALFCILGSDFAWDISSGEWFGLQVSTGENEAEPGEYACVAVSRDKGCGVIGFRTGYVQLLKYNSENGIELTRKFLVHTKGSVNDIAVMPDGDHVVSCSDDKTARIWDIRTGKVTMVFAHDDAVKHAAVIPDGSRLVACTAHHVHVWDVACGTTVYKPFQVHELRGVAVSPCGRRMVVCAAVKECAVRVYDIATGDVVASTVDNCPYLRVHSVAVLPDGDVVGGCSDGTVRVWRIKGNVLHPTRTMGLPRTPPRVFGLRVDDTRSVTPKEARTVLLNGES